MSVPGAEAPLEWGWRLAGFRRIIPVENSVTIFQWLSLAAALVPAMRAQSPLGNSTISVEERAALVALYQATGGPGWVHHDGWLGPAGSECHWYGVQCGPTVTGLDLADNGLTGRIPQELGGLKELTTLSLSHNAVKGPLPDVLLQRWDEGLLDVNPISLIHDVDEVRLVSLNYSVLCSGRTVRMAADGTIETVRRLQRGKARICDCEYRQGRTFEFARLGRFLVKAGYVVPREVPVRNTVSLDVEDTTATAVRGGRTFVLFSPNEPDSITSWALSAMLEGVAARADWTLPPSKRACSPQWIKELKAGAWPEPASR